MWGTLIDYWHYTGDESYVNTTKESLLFQTGPNNNYMDPNWTASLGNDDQAFWGMSAMLAAENVFPDPPADEEKQWLSLAQAVFNTQAHPDRHDETCGGGLRWQIPPHNNGYNYKNSKSLFTPGYLSSNSISSRNITALFKSSSTTARTNTTSTAISNGCFFNIGARLARYTSNSSYYSWAHDTYNWMKTVAYIDGEYNVYDGGHVEHNCTDINKAQFSCECFPFICSSNLMTHY